jgi:hypothetical protein
MFTKISLILENYRKTFSSYSNVATLTQLSTLKENDLIDYLENYPVEEIAKNNSEELMQ